MGLFEAQGQKAAGSHPFAEWCDTNGEDLSVKRFYETINQQRVWNDLLTGRAACALAVEAAPDSSEPEIEPYAGRSVDPELTALD